MPPVGRLFTRIRRRRARPLPQQQPASLASRGLGEAPSTADADDAELDTLRGELVRELDRIAAESDGPAGFRRS
jgi:hypothetical protein